MRYISFLIVVFTVLFYSFKSRTADMLTPDMAKDIAKEAYIYGFPMVMNYKTMYMYAIDESSPEYKAPFNEKNCEARLFTPDDRTIVTPNSDTPYCMFWADISREPQVISVPEMEQGRYYSIQLIDLFTHNFAYIGTLTSGNEAGNYLIAGKNWQGDVPAHIDQVIYCESDLFFNIIRTQLMDADDIDNVRHIQEQYKITGLNAFLGKESPRNDANIAFPVWNEGDQFSAQSLYYLDFLMQFTSANESETELLKRFGMLGIGSAEGFDFDKLDSEIQVAVEAGIKEGMEEMKQFIAQYTADPLVSAKIFGTRDFLTNSAKENFNLDHPYILRAVGADRGLYGNSGFEATYPTYLINENGQVYDASDKNYSLTFKKGELPPVKAFWSLTMYDGRTQLLVDNTLNRYLLNSGMEDDFKYNADGSLTLYIQKDAPENGKTANWLPAPDGPFYAVMRLYGPNESALNGQWTNPPLIETKR